jgi:hypothetical protein
MYVVVVIVAGVVGCVALVAAILAVVFGVIRRRLAAEAARLTDVVLDSGMVTMTTRFNGFRSERLIRSGYRRNPTQAVLTRSHFHLLERPQVYGVFTHEELGRFSVGVTSGSLHLRSSDPPRAQGTIDYRIPVRDPDEWVSALLAAGAQRADS